MAEGEVPGDYIMERQDLHDVVFLVGSEKKEKISTVKLFLANYSPVFRAMLLETDMREKHTEENIEIPNHEPDVFKLMLSYVYGMQDLKFLDVDQAMRFHLLVDQYLMTKLKALSSAYLMNECKNNIRDSLKCAVILDIKEMEPTATEILQSNIEHFLSSNDFKLLDRKIIEFILKLEHLSIEEIELWCALMSWVKYNYDEDTPGTTVREKLGNMLSYVRFLAMSQKEFAEEVVKTSILTYYEMTHMFVALVSGKPHGLKYLSEEGKRHPTVFVLEFKGYTTAQSRVSYLIHTIKVKNRRLRLNSVNLTYALSHFYVNLEKDQSKDVTFGPFLNCASLTLDIILEANQSYDLVFQKRSAMYASQCEPHYSCNYCTVLVDSSSCIKSLTFAVL